MPLNLPNLDDRTYEDLLAEARALIPTYAPEWTNHNPSDPGITLIELFAYLSEMLIYRLNRVTDNNIRAFLELITGPQLEDSNDNHRTLKEKVRDTIAELNQEYRAVTCEDFERLALEADPEVKRAHCVPRRNLDSASELIRAEDRPDHISLVIFPTEASAITSFNRVYEATGTQFQDLTETVSQSKGFRLIQDDKSFLYLGKEEPFSGIYLGISEKGKQYNLKLEYSTGEKSAKNQGWRVLTKQDHGLDDRTSNWSNSGAIRYTLPADWTQYSIRREDFYWLRISTETSPTSAAICDSLRRDLISKVAQNLEPRRLLTTKVHVVAPRIIKVSVSLTLKLKPDFTEADVKPRVEKLLRSFLNPLPNTGGGSGWPFGRNVYVSEIYALLDNLEGIDYVEKIQDSEGKFLDELNTNDQQRREPLAGELISIKIGPDELAEWDPELGSLKFSP